MRVQHQPDMVGRAADVGTGTSLAAFGISLTQINLVLQIIVSLIGIVAGCFAIYVYWTRIWSLRREDRRRERETQVERDDES